MSIIITNSPVASLSRNSSIGGVWQTVDGKGYSCRVGGVTLEFVLPDSSGGKVFIGLCNPDNLTYSVTIGESFSTLDNPPDNLPNPLLFNANWQGADGSMISWISNANNTGVSDSTLVMFNGNFYDLGAPILAAAVNNDFILAIHCTDGKAVLCEYSTKDSKNGSVVTRKEVKLNNYFNLDTDEIDRVDKKIQELKDSIAKNINMTAFEKALAASKQEIAKDYNVSVSTVEKNTSLLGLAFTESVATINKDCELKNIKRCGMTAWLYNRFVKFKTSFVLNPYKTRLTKGKLYSSSYRASFSPDLTTMLLHLDGLSNGTDPRRVIEFTDAMMGKKPEDIYTFDTDKKPISNGFATFSLAITWTNEEEIKNAIKLKLNPIPEKKYSYDPKFIKSYRFEDALMDWSAGTTDDGLICPIGIVRLPYNYDAGQQGIVVRGKLDSEVFLFAELVGNKPVWLSAKAKIKVLSVADYSIAGTGKGQVNWKEF